MLNSPVLSRIRECYTFFSPVEKTIADYFLQNRREENFTARHLSQKLHVSEAALSRFAQKAGYHGYREFIYLYESSFQNMVSQAAELPAPQQDVFSTYETILAQSFQTAQSHQLLSVAEFLLSSEQIFVYGLGSSGLAATEFELRLLKAGMDIKAFTDYHQMVLNEKRLKKGSLVIGISLSGETPEIRDALLAAAHKGAVTVCITAGSEKPWFSQIDKVLPAASVKGLEYGNMVSPMLPILLILDLLYVFCSSEKKAGTDELPEDEHVLWERLKHYHE